MGIPLALQSVLERGKCILFLGAGVGYNAHDKFGGPAPTGEKLAEDVAAHFGVDAHGSRDLAKIAQVVELRKGRAALDAFLIKRLHGLEPDDTLLWLLSRPWRAIFTTNYDSVIRRAYEMQVAPVQRPVVISSTSELVSFQAPFEVPVYHLHGALFDVDVPYALITEDDYARFRERRRMLFEILKLESAAHTILYIGYSHRDQNWKMVWRELKDEFFPSSPPQSYRVAPTTDDLDREILKGSLIETIDADLRAFRSMVEAVVPAATIDPDKLAVVEKGVPSGLHASFGKFPAATSRLASAWTLVNDVDFSEPYDVKRFLSGEMPSWSLIAGGGTFSRDVEEDIYDKMLDFATAVDRTRSIHVVLGAAGAGITTVLMNLAVRIVAEKAGVVLMHKSTAPFLPADIEFAASVFDGPIFVLVDQAAEHIEALSEALTRLSDKKLGVFFLVGDRTNEWRLRRPRLARTEVALEALSDLEIGRLLDFLAQHRALGVLEDLPRDAQFAAIKTKHEKQLLVALREATEGKAFDAIVIDEYSRLGSDAAKALYAVVCCAFHLRHSIRDQVLAKVVGKSLTDLYSETNDAVEGVVQYVEEDADRGTYAARARHQIIAEIVWDRCISRPERDRIILETLRALNLAIRTDAALFHAAVRTDEHVEALSTMEGRTGFFEEACRKDPSNPYVRQHYSRMLLREGRPELALSEIERALNMAPRLRVLLHTKGLALRVLCREATSEDIARKRLMQSEAAFRASMKLQKKDPHPYQGLAELYLDWSERVSKETESAEYIERAEQVLSDGMREVRERESLWIVSSRIEERVGNKPGTIAALQKAVASTPHGKISRYLLGRAYRKMGKPKEAIEVLQAVVNEDPSEFRAGLELALSKLAAGESYGNAIAVMRMCDLLGMSDPRFVATLGGFLTLDGRMDDARRLFSSVVDIGVSLEEIGRSAFRPFVVGEQGRPVVLEGTVAYVAPNFAFIESVGCGRFFCAARKASGHLLQKGQRMLFVPEFTVRGAQVYRFEKWLTP